MAGPGSGERGAVSGQRGGKRLAASVFVTPES